MYLFDDVLAAVDAHVGDHLLRHVLAGPLLAGRTRVLVSHSPAAAAAADVLVLNPKTLNRFLGAPAWCCQVWRLVWIAGKTRQWCDSVGAGRHLPGEHTAGITPLAAPGAHGGKFFYAMLGAGEAAAGYGRVCGTPGGRRCG